MCSECISDHKENDKCTWHQIKDAADLEKKKIESNISAVQNTIPHFVKKVDKIHRATVKSNTVSLKQKVDETFDEIIDTVKKRRSEVLEEVDKASLAMTTQLDKQREDLVKIKDAFQLTLDTGTTVCSQYDSVEFLAVKDYIEKASQSYMKEAQSAELSSPVCISNLTWVADEAMLESLRNYGEVKEECSQLVPSEEEDEGSESESDESEGTGESSYEEQDSAMSEESKDPCEKNDLPNQRNRRPSQGKKLPSM